MNAEEAYDELQCYTLSMGGEAFVHQQVVDVWMAQRADENTKPIGLTFALVGLYLHVEQEYSGRLVQKVHMALARRKRKWPTFPLPEDRGSVTVHDVVAAPPGPERIRAIDAWCASVWEAYSACRQPVIELLEEHGIRMEDDGEK